MTDLEKLQLITKLTGEINLETMNIFSDTSIVCSMEGLQKAFTIVAEKVASKKITVDQAFVSLACACKMIIETAQEMSAKSQKTIDELKDEIYRLDPNWKGLPQA